MTQLRLVDLGAGPYPHETPSERFPTYTRGNAGEVWPEVIYPLTLSTTRDAEGGNSDPLGRILIDTGMIRAEELAGNPAAAGGCFGGYMYLNLSVARTLALRTPGGTIEASDNVYFGSEGIAPPHNHHPGDKNWRATLASIRFLVRVLRTKEIAELSGDQAMVAGWKRKVPAMLELDDKELLAAIRSTFTPIIDLFTRHLKVSAEASGAVQFLTALCEREFDDPNRALELLTGLGDIDSAAPSSALWDLGRMVKADEMLTAWFNEGPASVAARLETSSEAAGEQPFRDAFAAFLDRFGSRGPNEWETACETWDTKPELALALVDRMRTADENKSPASRSVGLGAAREQLIERSRAEVSRAGRAMFDRSVRVATTYSIGRERSKTTVVGLIHVSRLLSRELAARVSSRVPGGQWEDMWFLINDELDAWVADPAAFVDVIAERRQTREHLKALVPPFVFDGEMPPLDTWERREEAGANVEPLAAGSAISGLSAVAGVAEGRACVVTDPLDPRDLGPGDVLIAPLTDPSWTPLFVPVEAVVVDVGGQMSHAVIVAREFGMPCVVAATDATTRIPDGARVRVDGDAGTVTVIELP